MAVDTQKLLALPPAKKGGKLKALPAANKSFSITTKVIEAKDILKGTLAARKVEQKKERQRVEKLKRKKKEEEIETPDNKDTKNAKRLGVVLPQMSWLDGVKNFIFTTLFGWVAIRMLDSLPKLVKLLKPIASIAEFIIKTGAFILNALVAFVDAGYKAYDWTRGAVKKIGGEDAVKQFDSFMGTLNKVMNLVIALGIAAGSMGMAGRGGPKRGIVNQGKRLLKKGKRFFDPKRTQKLKRVKNIKEIAKQRKIAENALKRQRLLRRIRPTNVRRTAQVVSQKAINRVRNIFPKSGGGPGLLQRAKGFGSNILQKGKNIGSTIVQKGKGALTWADDLAKSQMKNLNKMIKGIGAKAVQWRTQIGEGIEKMNPAKLAEKVKSTLSGQLDDILKQNKLIAKLKNLNVKNAAKSIGGLMKNAQKSKGLATLMKGLEGAKKMKIGGVDKVIAAIMGVINYAAFGESPINAILQAIGGLLGYTAGFAIGAPFGGFPGFITGMAGAWVGEQAAKLIAKGLAQTGLANTPDPIAQGLGLSPRMLVRDPFGGSTEGETEGENKTKSKKIDKIFKIGDKELDLSKVMGGLSREEYDALDTGDRKRLNRRMTIWRGQNPEEWHAGIKNNTNSVAANSISKYASYEDGGDDEVVENQTSGAEDESSEEGDSSDLELTSVGGGGDSTQADLFYKNSG